MSDVQPTLVVVIAVARGGAIGLRGDLPWKISEDLRHFKRLTDGHVVIMGRKTHNSIGRALPNRTNFVVSHDQTFQAAPGCVVFHDVQQAVDAAKQLDASPRIIGGASLYAAVWPQVRTIYLTEIDRDVEADTFFALNRTGFAEVAAQPAISEPDVRFVTLERVDVAAHALSVEP